MTLLESTVVIAALVVLVSILFVGARAWIKGSDRAACVLAIRNVQVATRTYQNTHGYNYGTRPTPEIGTQDIAKHLLYRGYIEQSTYDEIEGHRKCPAGGNYYCPVPDVFPPLGTIYMRCTLASESRHTPSEPDSW